MAVLTSPAPTQGDTIVFTKDELSLLHRGLWDSIARIDRRDDELVASGVPHSEVYQRRNHLSAEVYAVMAKVEQALNEAVEQAAVVTEVEEADEAYEESRFQAAYWAGRP